MRILIVEDDQKIREYLIKGLKEAGHVVDSSSSGDEGLQFALKEVFDVIIMDRMLPGLDGLAVIKALRASSNTTPILILSSLAEVDDRVTGLKAGGDDYLVKPFAFSELLARVEILGKRKVQDSAPSTLKVADLEMDLLSRKVTRGSRTIELKTKEFQLLEYLMKNSGNIVTRNMILENAWNYNFDPGTNVIDVHISRLRKKIDEGREVKLIQTIRGAGYSLKEPQ